MAKAKKSMLRPVVIFLIGILLIALSFTFWYFIVSPFVSLNTYSITPTSVAHPTIPKASHTVYVNVTDRTLNVTDRAHSRATSNIAQITMKSAFAASISPSSVAMNINQTQTFNVAVVSGTGPYSYHWYSDGKSVAGAISFALTYNATIAGSHTVYVSVIDSLGACAISNIARITVNSTLSVSILPSSVVMDSGQSQTFNAVVVGGTGNYSYQWYLDGSPVTNATNPTWNYTATFAQTSLTLQFGQQQTTGNTSQPVDHSLDLSIKIDATGPVQVTVYEHSNPIFNARTNATYKTILVNSTAGSHSVYVKVTDSVGAVAISNVARTNINSAFAVSISPSSATMSVGQSQLFTSNITGGTGPYSYRWYLDGSPVASTTGSSPTYNLVVTAGSHSVYVNVTDSVGAVAISNVARTNLPTTFAASISPSSIFMNVNQSQTFNATVVGGSGNYSYSWYLDGKQVTGATRSAWNFTLATAPSTILFPDLVSPISVSLSDAFTGGTIPYMVIQNLNTSSSVSVSYFYEYAALFRNSDGLPLIMFIIGVIIVVVEGIVLLRVVIKRVRGR